MEIRHVILAKQILTNVNSRIDSKGSRSTTSQEVIGDECKTNIARFSRRYAEDYTHTQVGRKGHLRVWYEQKNN